MAHLNASMDIERWQFSIVHFCIWGADRNIMSKLRKLKTLTKLGKVNALIRT